LVPFNSDLILQILSIKKKYISEPLPLPVRVAVLSAEPLSQITISETRSLNRPVTLQITVINGTIIMQFPIKNTSAIEGIINRLNTQTPLITAYKTVIKTYVQHAVTEALIRDTTMKKLKEAAANKKKRSKKTIRLSTVYPKTWKFHLETQRVAKRKKQKVINNKRKAAAKKAAGKNKSKTNEKSKDKNKSKNKGKDNEQLAIETSNKIIDSLFQKDHEKENNKIKAQLAAELDATTLNKTTTRSNKIRRTPVRYRNSWSLYSFINTPCHFEQ
jgi:hypothetical protein